MNIATQASEPNFFIVGAMKAGTTSICRYISQHPSIFISPVKEPGYYVWENLDHPDALLVYGASGLTTMSSTQLIRTREDYARLFRRASSYEARGEASVLYLPHPNAARRIKKRHPQAKIIALLRNPISRAYSAYTFRKSHGLDPADSFREALESELSGKRDNWSYGWRYLYSGSYCRQIARYIRSFGEARVLLLSFDDLRADPRRLCQRVFDHLGIPKNIPLRTDFVANPTRIPPVLLRSSIMSGLDCNIPLKETIKRAVPIVWRDRLRQGALATACRFGRRARPMSSADRRFLLEYYDDEINEIQRLTGWNVEHWRATYEKPSRSLS